MSDNTYDQIDVSIREMIVEGRSRFHAVTARWVAAQLNLSADVCRHRLLKMQNEGLVDWNEMPGSLRLTEASAPGEDLAALSATTTTEEMSSSDASTDDDSPPPAAPTPRAAPTSKRPARAG
jgi:hypothetical protein